MTIEKILLYTLSTIPQVLAATSALLGVYVFFCIKSIKEILIGDGKSALCRSKDKEPGYRLDDIRQGRLRDAIFRKNIEEIEGILNDLKQKELSKEEKPGETGLSYVYATFSDAKKQMKRLKDLSIFVLSISVFSILISVLSLSLMDLYHTKTLLWDNLIRYFNIVIFFIALIGTLVVIIFGLTIKTKHQTDKKRSILKSK